MRPVEDQALNRVSNKKPGGTLGGGAGSTVKKQPEKLEQSGVSQH